MVTGSLPVAERISGCVIDVFTGTLPKASVEVLMLSAGTAALSWRANDCDTPPRLAVNVAPCAELTAEILAENCALVAPAATANVEGTATAALLLVRLTARPLLSAAAFNVMEQTSVPAPRIEPLVQLSELNTGTPVPLRLTVVELPVAEVLAMLNCPVAGPVAAGLN